MKPRTKYQKQVVTSNKGLRPIKGAQMQWAFRECLDHYAFQLKHGQTTCMDCGHTWTTDEDADKCVCPKCKAKLEVQRTKRQKAMSSTYFSVLTERKGLQLMRAFQMKAYYRKGQKADIYCWEVARYWMNEKGKVEVMARKRTEQSFFVPKAEIAANGYDLSINKYKETEYVPVEYPSTTEILADLHELEMEITKGLAELEEMV